MPRTVAALRAALTLDRALLLWALAAVAGGAAALTGRRAGSARRGLGSRGPADARHAGRADRARRLLRGEPGVDIIAACRWAGALALGETLAGVVIALMFTGGNVLEEFAQRRAERELTALLGRAPRTAHREPDGALADLPVEEVAAAATGCWSRAARCCRSTAPCSTGRRRSTNRRSPARRAGGAPRRAARAQRHAQCRRAVPLSRPTRPRPTAPMPTSSAWSRRRSREGAVRAARQPLVAGLPAADPGDRRRSPGWSRATRSARWRCWSWPPPAR